MESPGIEAGNEDCSGKGETGKVFNHSVRNREFPGKRRTRRVGAYPHIAVYEMGRYGDLQGIHRREEVISNLFETMKDKETSDLLVVQGLKRFFGAVQAVKNVSFTIGRGQVVGLIGANGAGKTTTMRILATLDEADDGVVYLNGYDIAKRPEKVRQHIGWMPDYFQPYAATSVREYLDFFARAYGFKGKELQKVVWDVMDFTGLFSLSDRLMDKLSKGQTQRLCLARTLINDPDFLILDEPAAGLDPKARLEFKNLVKILKDRGKTILISSHILSELAEMCETFIFMNEGEVVHDGDKDSLLEETSEEGWCFEIAADMPAMKLEEALSLRSGWKVLEQTRNGVVAEYASRECARIAEELGRLTRELPVYDFHRREQRLEDAFVNMLRKENKVIKEAPATDKSSIVITELNS